MKKTILPTFKYNPDPIQLGIIKEQSTLCPSCGESQNYAYNGPFYSVNEGEGICPWCIADGSAAAKFEGEFQDSASCEPVEEKEYLDELVHRTPGYVAWQQATWLSHCGNFCAIVQYVGWKEIAHLEDELAEDIKSICNDFGITKDELQRDLINEGNLQGYLFRCIHCDRHRLSVDCL